MAELVIRVSGQDAALIDRVYGRGGASAAARRPNRLVVDAHVAAAHPEIAATARRAGVPFLVDPLTHYLQDVQHPADPWARLSFADGRAHTPSDLASNRRQERLVEECLSFQIEHGATTLIVPYVHIEKADDGWVDIQRRLLAHTCRFLDRNNVHIPVMAVFALGWRLLDRMAWPSVLNPLLEASALLGPAPVALAAAKVDQGVHPERRLADLLATVGQIRPRHPVTAWNQGALGEACVAGGATGYEVGIGWRERCDLRSASAAHRQPPSGGGGARPVYVASVRRSVPKPSLRVLMTDRVLLPHLICPDLACCTSGPAALLGDPRAHTIVARARNLAELDAADTLAWKWHLLAQISERGLRVAERVNIASRHQEVVNSIDTAALLATHAVATVKRRNAAERAA
ncbi:hypothetical protein [Jatrophihabitans sp.]|jgi:hypothetical protein|uniref:hypothetical protein n=1 Tax=Jatrophihabitans sp. TaxID=1932789 RepID=UPI002F112E17